MRASDHLREATVGVLRSRALDGCLSLDTFASRVEGAYRARTVAELDELVADLPGGRLLALRRLLRRAFAPPRRPAAEPAVEIEVKLPTTAPAVTVGRAATCDVVVGESTVSREHAELRHNAGRWFVRDLGSKNGTWLNGRRVAEAPVSRGDVLRLGGLRMELRL